MNIRIEYDGTMAKCYIQDTFGKDPFKEVPFNEADNMSQVFALGAFSCIKECWKREQMNKLATEIKLAEEKRRNEKSN